MLRVFTGSDSRIEIRSDNPTRQIYFRHFPVFVRMFVDRGIKGVRNQSYYWFLTPFPLEYRAEIDDLLSQGRTRGAMAREIWDVRRAAAQGSGNMRKYNGAMREMLDYARKIGYLLD